jgi:hypothetical protein
VQKLIYKPKSIGKRSQSVENITLLEDESKVLKCLNDDYPTARKQEDFTKIFSPPATAWPALYLSGTFKNLDICSQRQRTQKSTAELYKSVSFYISFKKNVIVSDTLLIVFLISIHPAPAAGAWRVRE